MIITSVERQTINKKAIIQPNYNFPYLINILVGLVINQISKMKLKLKVINILFLIQVKKINWINNCNHIGNEMAIKRR